MSEPSLQSVPQSELRPKYVAGFRLFLALLCLLNINLVRGHHTALNWLGMVPLNSAYTSINPVAANGIAAALSLILALGLLLRLRPAGWLILAYDAVFVAFLTGFGPLLVVLVYPSKDVRVPEGEAQAP